ncbi:VOC family protein [Parapedobacter koreensis]|uniref:Glyoxalase superfamily enzyme, possibly 3-demethylubiquinone-9 3-methyltransferase n=1 Tax=Parapedobacter koreensis TaxID=332977 RepID=A0A1H7J5N8_9SPHI|nr:VOC family protein [Parapedobacter koreensis]SEK70083.1 Glyoxalase superfamily enzyme, possibly 3-demethylubiquinone-9 3-methyltransferase [Parapedobacter koreensis]
MKNSIYPCLWFDGNAKAAANLYCSVFANATITADTPMVVTFELDGIKFMGLNGGSQFKPNAAISFYVTLEDRRALEGAWSQLADGGTVLMPLDKYGWSERYGWVQDRFGVNWQLSLGNSDDVGQRFVPLLMFCGEQQGKAGAAMDHYMSVFRDSAITFLANYAPGQVAHDATIVHARFRLLGDQVFMAMDSAVPQPFTFNEGISLVIDCETQEEVDDYWDKLTEGGEESMCGWVKDRFGVWWQVVPTILPKLLGDPGRAERVMQAYMKMKKFDIEALLDA